MYGANFIIPLSHDVLAIFLLYYVMKKATIIIERLIDEKLNSIRGRASAL